MPEKNDIYSKSVWEMGSTFLVCPLCRMCKHLNDNDNYHAGYKYACKGGGENSNTAFARSKKDNYNFPQVQNDCELFETIQQKQSNTVADDEIIRKVQKKESKIDELLPFRFFVGGTLFLLFLNLFDAKGIFRFLVWIFIFATIFFIITCIPNLRRIRALSQKKKFIILLYIIPFIIFGVSFIRNVF